MNKAADDQGDDGPDPERSGPGGCLKVPYADDNGEQAWVRFILAHEDLIRETAFSTGQPALSKVEYQALVEDIRF